MRVRGNRRLLVLLVVVAAVIAFFVIRGCGDDDGGGNGESGSSAAGEYADGACVDASSLTSTGSGVPGVPATPTTPQVVDCDSPEAAGVLKEVEKISECPSGQGFAILSVGQEGQDTGGGAFCIEAK